MRRRIELSHGAYLVHDECFLSSKRADRLFSQAREQIDWEQGHVTLFGRRLPEPRLTAWFSPSDYTYSGRTLAKAPWPDFLLELGRDVEHVADAAFDSVLANLYRDGKDGVGFHADDERELGQNPQVVSISLGTTRRFLLRPKKKSDPNGITLELGHGALLIMGGSCQHHYRHSVPKQLPIRDERINFTFRRMNGGQR